MAKAELELAKAMNRLADSLDVFQDPLWWQKTVGAGLQTMLNTPGMESTFQRSLPPGVRVESLVISLSDEEREKMSQKIYEALKPQIKEFDGYVKESLAELPSHRLRELAEKIDKGLHPTIQRRRGCIFLALEDGTEAHLGL